MKIYQKTNNPFSPFRRPTTPLRRSWQSPNERPRSKLTKTLQLELNQYSERIKILKAENKRLRSLLSALNTYETGSDAPPFLIQHFQSELNYMYDLINKRAICLNNLEAKVKSSRITKNSDIPPQGEKARLLYENSQLIDFAFRQEQVSIVEHSKLHISHDLRDLCKYKKYVQDIIDQNPIDFNYEEEEVKNKKKRIENLKKAIEYEKSRIISMQTPQFEINEAAKLIQKHWRGYYQRKHELKHNGKLMVEYEDETDETVEYNLDSTSNELSDDNLNENGDVIGVFNVTGVANTQDSNEFEDKIFIAPADAFNNHKNNLNDKYHKKSPKLNNTCREVAKKKPLKKEIKQETTQQKKQVTNDIVTDEKNSEITENKKNLEQNELNDNQQNLEKTEENKHVQIVHSQTEPNTISPAERLRLENLNQPLNQTASSPINIKTYMSD